ncbi:hypothetical protein DPMN_055176 [Dreissena polymorpha]|uniref:Uncharacterized protein n=1 Tax=Dreissena polymorpha TaxID=45954 RepID=A0A9D4CPH4_DREPO|nr:hypothetical protein DPMN_085938 [Dreissena polymorpha]KAH3729210.1 hypothetical protein DPMN_055176 [Dreissena polymorpha]
MARSKKESRQDSRVSSASIGRVAVVVMVTILVMVISLDLTTLWKAIKKRWCLNKRNTSP